VNAEHFEEWLRGILPKLQKDSILVLDNVPYHSRKVEKTPTAAWRKAQIQDWLHTKNLNFEDTMIKVELLEIIKKEKITMKKNLSMSLLQNMVSPS
jgi:predicted O-methyltransferase YrrM